MYLRPEIVAEAVPKLENLHIFFGNTFLVCKKKQLPVGKTVKLPINNEEEAFLTTYYKPYKHSGYFFTPFKTSSLKGRWLHPRYPSTGSQSTRTRGIFQDAFIHPRNTDLWGWKEKYIEVLKKKLEIDHTERVPIFWLAVWLFRDKEWPAETTAEDILNSFYDSFYIHEEEKKALFDTRAISRTSLFREEPLSEADLRKIVGPPPDFPAESGGTLKLLELKGVGPSRSLLFEPGDRLTLVTGDNGLGKSFILECTWWSLTGAWAEYPALPRKDAKREEPKISFEIMGPNHTSHKKVIQYDWGRYSWPYPKGRPTIPGLIVYARIDGSFAIWDPVRQMDSASSSSSFVFDRNQVIYGLADKMEGLLRDWVKWQHSPDQSLFKNFLAVLSRLSPPDLGTLAAGKPVRIAGDAREIPTLVHPYGEVPFINESAGVKRIITLAYLLVWAWNEHKIYSELARKSPQKRIVILVDEIEAHLHPKWQREILPAILDVTRILSENIEPQIIVATHSPLILASAETQFCDDTDRLFHLSLNKEGKVSFAELPFVRYGGVEGWLTSDIFEMKEARSREGEEALEQAKKILGSTSPTKEEIIDVTNRLKEAIAADDTFWIRWQYFAKRKGVDI
jgi:hypothetical protein